MLGFGYEHYHPKPSHSRLSQWCAATIARSLVRGDALAVEYCTRNSSEAYRECGLSLTGNDLSRWLTQWKRTAGHEWLAEIPATCLTQCLRDQDAAFRNFFGGRARYPKFKRKGHPGVCGFRTWDEPGREEPCSLPKLDSLKLAEALPEVERPDLVTLSRDAVGRYHVSFSAQVPKSLLPIRIARWVWM